MWTKKKKIILPDDMDQECIELCDVLNTMPGTETFDSCSGHGKYLYMVFFKCTNINTLSRLGRAVSRNYSDGNWEILVDSTDTDPRGIFWLRSTKILVGDELEKSLHKLIANIKYWCKDDFDEYFSKKIWPGQISPKPEEE